MHRKSLELRPGVFFVHLTSLKSIYDQASFLISFSLHSFSSFSSSWLNAIIACNHLPFFKIFSNFVLFCPNFQIFCPFSPFFNIFWSFGALFLKITRMPLLSRICPDYFSISFYGSELLCSQSFWWFCLSKCAPFLFWWSLLFYSCTHFFFMFLSFLCTDWNSHPPTCHKWIRGCHCILPITNLFLVFSFKVCWALF